MQLTELQKKKIEELIEAVNKKDLEILDLKTKLEKAEGILSCTSQLFSSALAPCL